MAVRVRRFIGEAVKRALTSRGLTREQLAYQVLPKFLMELMQGYLRVDVEGTRYVPKEGPYILISNHSGFMGFDATMITYQIALQNKDVPKIIAHKLWFLRPEISVHAKKMGLVPATFDNGLKILEKGKPLLLFPEGEEGNFKPTRYRYRLRRFRRGFVRLALQTGAPIVPSIVIGAEETSITLSQIRWAKELTGIIIPVPLNIVPLPAKWTIRFLPPIRLKKDPAKAEDLEYVTKLSRKIRHDLQHELNTQLKQRTTVFLG